VRAGEELLMDYRFQKNKARHPSWYHPVGSFFAITVEYLLFIGSLLSNGVDVFK